jgi:putative endonuclease
VSSKRKSDGEPARSTQDAGKRADDEQAAPASPWFVYLLECRGGSIYTGVAVDVAARYAAHASGKGARYTRSHPPLRLLATLEYPDQSSALKAEYRIKQMTAPAKRRFIAGLGGATSRTIPAAAARDSHA